MTLSLTFLGAVGTVTGSKFLLHDAKRSILVDCGLFQGYKQLRLRNWKPLPVAPAGIDTVVLTHAHLDHSGYVPLLVRDGFAGRVLATPATRDLCNILLRDSGFLMERDADFANRHGFSKHRPALPLYTQQDAERSLTRFDTVPFGHVRRLGDDRTLEYLRAGHILGAAIARIVVDGRTIVFSGDLGRPNSNIMHDPAIVTGADYLVLESTYGDRRHDPGNPEDALADTINRTAARGGSVIVPAFAVGRCQTLLFHLSRLKDAKRIPAIPIYLDSPMAQDASDIYRMHPDDHRLSAAACHAAFGVARYVRTSEESKLLDVQPMPKIIVSASGMATGGRVLHHLKHYLPDERNTILFTGFQAPGTRGADLVRGVDRIRIHGDDVPVRASVENLSMLSAHADADEIIGWLRGFETPPRRVFLVHGEPAASDALRKRIETELGWACTLPEQGETIAL